jgi:hypothetical protein
MNLAFLELLRAFSGAFRKELPIEAGLPLNIQLALERLRLAERLAEAAARTGAEPSLRAVS